MGGSGTVVAGGAGAVVVVDGGAMLVVALVVVAAVALAVVVAAALAGAAATDAVPGAVGRSVDVDAPQPHKASASAARVQARRGRVRIVAIVALICMSTVRLAAAAVDQPVAGARKRRIDSASIPALQSLSYSSRTGSRTR